MNGIVKVESEVPFGHMLHNWLHLRDVHLDQLVRHDQIEMRYLAWETVRKQMNPFFQNGTGFEGYLVSRCPTAEAALGEIIAINQDILDAIARLYRFQYDFRRRLMRTLTREDSDPEAIHIWSTYLGMELGKLRAQMLHDPQAELFRKHTYTVVRTLPPMIYHETEDDVTQSYAVGLGSSHGKILVLPAMLKPNQQDAWLVAAIIGEFGHPLVRNLIDRDRIKAA